MDPETSSDEETDDEELLPEETLSHDKKISRKIKTNHCNCEICMKARVCLLNYPTYESTDIFTDKFHNSIKHTCETHKLIL